MNRTPQRDMYVTRFLQVALVICGIIGLMVATGVGAAGPITISVTTNPNPLHVGSGQLQVTLTNLTGAPQTMGYSNTVSGFRIFTAAASQGTCFVTGGGSQAACNLGVVASGGSVTVTLSGQVVNPPGQLVTVQSKATAGSFIAVQTDQFRVS